MKKVFYILRIFLKLSLIFLICFIWSRFVFKQLWLCIVSSIGLSILIETIYYFISKKTKANRQLKLSEKENSDDMYMSLLNNDNNIDFFYQLFLSRHSSTVKKKNYIEVKTDDNFKTIVYPFITPSALSSNDLFNISKAVSKEKPNKLIVLCYDYSKDTILFAKNLNFEVVMLNRYDTFAFLYKEYEFYPTITTKNKKAAKLTFKDLLAYSFNKSRTKGYVISALFLFVTSFFVKLNLYYCIIASVLLLFALISYINPRYNTQKLNNLI